jgi:hypothetical protein
MGRTENGSGEPLTGCSIGWPGNPASSQPFVVALYERVTVMKFFDWAALIMGAGLIVSGVRTIRRRQARVPEEYTGENAVRLGWLWIGLGALFVLGVIFDIGFLKVLFRLFLESA